MLLFTSIVLQKDRDYTSSFAQAWIFNILGLYGNDRRSVHISGALIPLLKECWVGGILQISSPSNYLFQVQAIMHFHKSILLASCTILHGAYDNSQ